MTRYKVSLSLLDMLDVSHSTGGNPPLRVKSLRGRVAATRPATAMCACQWQLPLDLPPPNAPATGPATAMCACHSTCYHQMRLPRDLPWLCAPATTKCACHQTCHNYVRLPLDLLPPNAPATGPAMAMCACHHQMRLPPDLPQLCAPATRQQARS